MKIKKTILDGGTRQQTKPYSEAPLSSLVSDEGLNELKALVHKGVDISKAVIIKAPQNDSRINGNDMDLSNFNPEAFEGLPSEIIDALKPLSVIAALSNQVEQLAKELRILNSPTKVTPHNYQRITRMTLDLFGFASAVQTIAPPLLKFIYGAIQAYTTTKGVSLPPIILG